MSWIYGLLLVFSILVALYLFWRRSNEAHIESYKAFDLAFEILLVGLLGGRLGYYLLNLDKLGISLLKFFWLSYYPGLSVPGALILIVMLLYFKFRDKKSELFKTLDAIAIPMAVIWVAVSLGEYLLSWDIRMFITMAGGLLVMGLGTWVESHYRFWEWYKAGRVAAEPGLVFFVSLAVYTLSYLGVTYGRSLEQWVVPGALLVAVWGIGLRNRKLTLFKKRKLR